ncbi:MAG: FAD-dependent oxidoreductase [Rhodanobacteraceae bacterium]|nr:FAD-dependent oxidoreductase [Rhodanobacteraceae bacterium]
MKIAVVGSGISGIGAAWLLSREHEVTLFEANDYVGGNTHTHEIELNGAVYHVDTGFIVCNPDHYPHFFRMLGELGVDTQETTMSFAVRNERSGLEYNATDLDRLFVQRRNLLSPRFWTMVHGILKFYREAPALLELPDIGPDLGDYLEANGYSTAFRDDHLLPMASALWSSPSAQILRFPAKYLVAFMANHQMMVTRDRKPWRVVRGGSSSYIRAMLPNASFTLRTRTPVRSVQRDAAGVCVTIDGGSERFDQIVFACHSDQALALLVDPSEREHEILGAIGYQHNDTVLHTDVRLLPRRRKAWAAWNALMLDDERNACTVTYDMSQLQQISAPENFCVTLNCSDRVDPARILKRLRYQHPIYTRASVAAQARRHEISGQQRTWYAGAYWGWGFHEDGMRSAVDVARALGVSWP